MINNGQQNLQQYLDLISASVGVQVLIVLTGAWLLAVVVDKLILSWLRNIVARVDEKNPLVATRHGPFYYSILLLGLASTLMLLELPQSAHNILVSILETIAVFVWARFCYRIIRFLLVSTAHNDERLPVLNSKSLPLFENIVFILIIVIAVYAIFVNWHIDMTAWLASAGIVGIAVGFAAKDTLANLFSGLFIMADAPYKIGDYVVLDSGERGEIIRIGIRSTRMLTRDGLEITIPNAIIGNAKITNESGEHQQKSRISIKVGVAYGSDIDQVRAVLLAVGETEISICDEPEPKVRFRRFGASGLDFELLCWIDEPALRGKITDDLNTAVYKAFAKEHIEIPYAKQDIYIKQMPKIERENENEKKGPN